MFHSSDACEFIIDTPSIIQKEIKAALVKEKKKAAFCFTLTHFETNKIASFLNSNKM